eukprot:CAMPEP_0197495148 /NCGR_PEP_ID=MMETSP1311-20131121/34780_1 /TAXON_ID=464262 /ORGANISM="Genus nov. species nov., Strain RCC856" /LENGTH=65 /DNA_ID=CAMNT_0043040619 /DNA_START=10 /DNA_END=204 /DNA_ORIENTATION=+
MSPTETVKSSLTWYSSTCRLPLPFHLPTGAAAAAAFLGLLELRPPLPRFAFAGSACASSARTFLG